MKRQKSFKNNANTLFLVATPIGNRHEFSDRAIETLKSVDVIACEDTRTSKVLLDTFDIHTKCISYHNFNEKESTKGIIELLKSGKNIALISDAGYPLISDPGYELVNACVENDFNVVTVSGPNACLNALVASALPTNHYLYYGFLSAKSSDAKRELEEVKEFPYTMVFYESPHRIEKTLKIMLDVLGDRKACLARELTKQYEEYIRGNLSEFVDLDDIKGEMVIVVEGYTKEEVSLEDIDTNSLMDELIEKGLSTKEAATELAKEYGLSKKDIYNNYHKK